MKIMGALCYALAGVELVAGRGTLPKRQDDQSISTTAAPSDPTDGASTSRNLQEESTQRSRELRSTSAENGRSSIVSVIFGSALSGLATASQSASLTTSTTIAPSTASSSTTPPATDAASALPFQPRITPALGIAGALMMIAGATLTLIGIKNQSFHIFLSCALLASLAVTVLILYVMHPPAPDAIQGAYVVAAVVTGAIFGAVSLIFKEITEGLGCLLGGFCLAMWFLGLSPGGLVHSTSGVATMIGVFSAVALSVSFSHYTRSYGLIGCTAFAGSTVTILGIDCFSRAGLKEFWLYIWGLNDDTFPINTDTYPITRGIKVEVAAIIIVFVFGVLSQLKIWKIVKEKREKRDQERQRKEAAGSEEDAAAGRQVLENDSRERAEWEAEYGDRKAASYEQADSGMGSSVVESLRKSSMHVVEREVDTIEMSDFPATSPKNQKPQATIIERMASDDSMQQLPGESRQNLLESSHASRTGSLKSRDGRSVRDPFTNSGRTSLHSRPSRESFHGAPPIVPLPFSLPQEPGGRADDPVERNSTYSSHDMVDQPGATPLAFDTLRRHTSFGAPRVESDRASSVAATADDGPDFDNISRAPSPYDVDANQSRLSLMVPHSQASSRNPSNRSSMVEAPVEENDNEVLERPVPTVATQSASAAPKQRRRSTATSHRKSTGSARSRRLSEPGLDDDSASTAGSLRHRLPEKLSKIAMTYRTNEWAKHIAAADQPDDEDETSSSPGIQVDHAFAEEAARPVGPVEKETLQSQPLPEVLHRKVSQASVKSPDRRSRDQPQLSRQSSSAAITPVYAFQQSESSLPPPVAGGAKSTQGRPAIRVPSAPMTSQPFMVSPIEEDPAVRPIHNFSAPLASPDTNNLMSQRSELLKRKTTSTSFNALHGSAPNVNLIAPSDSASSRNVNLERLEESEPSRSQTPEGDNLTLGQRKSLMQQQRTSCRQSTHPPPVAPNASFIYDSNQPKRTNTVDASKQSRIYSQWRQSLQADAAAKQPQWNEDSARQTMMFERRQLEQAQQMEAARAKQRQSTRDSMMRAGALNDVHRQAMRKMQAKANKG